MSELRDRIAAALKAADESWDEVSNPYLGQADALIEQLGLRPEWGALDSDFGGTLADSPEELKLYGGESIMRRYITEWERFDE